MASSRKSSKSKARPRDLAARLLARLAPIVLPGDRLVVGLSGGVDSMALLDCMQRVAARLGVRLGALHVNHQLSPNAGAWDAFCRRQCKARGVRYASVRVVVSRAESVEAAARDARYSVFARQRADYIVLAQHQDDQVETLVLQLLRGAGVKGLAAMPLLRKSEGRSQKAEGVQGRRGVYPLPVTHHPSPGLLRPLLEVTRAEILEYAAKRRLEWIEDESNASIDFRRNFLRHEVLPVIARCFPSYRVTVARSAGHLAEAAELLDELAAQDAADAFDGVTLAVAALRRLPSARARNLLRFFLARRGVIMPNVERLEEALRQAQTARQDARVAIDLGSTTLRRYLGRLYLVPALSPLPRSYARSWRGERKVALPELGGVLVARRTRGTGISMARLRSAPVTVRLRRGGERLKPDCRRPSRSLKNLLQESQVPPWRRGCLPLLFCGSSLVWVPGAGIACDFQAVAGEASLEPRWLWQQEGG
jgi:tRNA(Ile)-lysidine synthase